MFSAYAAELGKPITVEAFSVGIPDPDVKVEPAAQGRYRVQAKWAIGPRRVQDRMSGKQRRVTLRQLHTIA
ncbi:hypothetical protein [Streptomyces cyaneus]|uniref:hypothetical protein n=1 Tax=Streptomyces cyaneus TaxID=1904 RepID=UPI000FF8AD04|nr:hypothetical protein [Streptomyces cyaneus]